MPFTLKALFKMAGGCYGGDVIEQTIVRVTGGPECHVEAMISEDPLLCFSAHMSTGVRTLPYLGGHSSLWYGLDTGVEVTPEAVARWEAAPWK